MQLCKKCGAGHLYVSHEKGWTIIYCGECGSDYREPRDMPMEAWADKKQNFNSKKMRKIS